MTVSIVIATGPGRELQAQRAAIAYVRETPGEIAIGFCEWQQAMLPEGFPIPANDPDVVHFTTDEIEPHPGWLPAALAAIAADRIPSPILWSADGIELNAGLRVSGSRDWSSAVGSELPTMSWRQVLMFGTPPIPDEKGAQYVVRHDYAFTRHAT